MFAGSKIDPEHVSHVNDFFSARLCEQHRAVLKIDATNFGHGKAFLMTVFENHNQRVRLGSLRNAERHGTQQHNPYESDATHNTSPADHSKALIGNAWRKA
jgi:hypothetical protein